jgi:hypothetical protein
MEARHVATGSPRPAQGVACRPRLTLARRAALVLATLTIATAALPARADAYIYWTNPSTGAISRANLDGTGVDQSFIPLGTSQATAPRGVAVDGAHVYWTRFGTDNIGRANLDGTGVDPSFIAAPVGQGSQVAVDGAHVYWVSKYSSCVGGGPGTSAIGRANLDGTAVDVNFISGISCPAGSLAVDGSHLYWTGGPRASTGYPYGAETRPSTAIGRANLDGTGVQENFIATTNWGVAVDEAHVWWVAASVQTGLTPGASTWVESIGRSNLDGTGTELVTEPGEVGASAIAVNDTHVYWTGGVSIGRSNLDGSAVNQCLIIGTAADTGLAVDALGPPPSSAPAPSNEIRLGKAKLDTKQGTAKLTVKVPGPGDLYLRGRLATPLPQDDHPLASHVKRVHKRAERSGKLKLSVKARREAKKRLNKTGKVKVKAKVVFSPRDCGFPDTKFKTIKLVKR